VSGPQVSIVIPTHNRADLAVLAVRSCLEHQDGVDLEVIVVDDGGTDDTAGAIEAIDGPVRYIWKEWAGRAVARNHGVDLARAPLVAFLDSDDLVLPGRFRRQLERLEPDVVAVWGQVEIVGERGEPLDQTAGVQRLLAEAARAGVTPERQALANRIYPSALTMRKDVFLRLGGFDRAFRVAEDVEFSVRLAREGPLAFEPEPVAAIRHHSGNSRIDVMFREHVELTSKLVRLCAQPHESPLRARLLSDQARALWSLGETARARTAGLAAVREDPTVLREPGVAKRFFGSLLPQSLTNATRQVVRRVVSE
jgi:glycosyltransferase involved in cell wall biosynthesis